MSRRVLAMNTCRVALLACAAIASAAAAPPSLAAPSGTASLAERCPWIASKAPIPQRVEQLLGRMTLDQKIHMLHGVRGGDYVGEVPGIPSLCIPALTMQDGPAGLGDGMTGGTQLPAPIALAAAWDRDLAARYAAVIGAEQRGKGITLNLGPTLNIVRDPRWGRAFETYGEDPYLTGQIGIAYVRGMQGTGTLAQVKHLAVYNQETNRNTPADNAIIDERTLQEIYLAQFAAVIGQAHPASVMCSYNAINGVAACEDPYTLTHVLRQQMGYRGFVVSDWGGTHSTAASANAGLNIEMPEGEYFGEKLKQAVAAGEVSMATIDGLVRPVLAEMFRFRLFARAPAGSPDAVVTTPEHVALARAVAEQGAVLLKNAGGMLPLSDATVRSIAVIGTGAGAGAATVGGGSAHVLGAAIVTPFQGIAARAGTQIRVRHAQGNTPVGEPPVLPAKYLTPATGTGHGLSGRFYRNQTLSGSPALTRDAPRIDFDWGRAAPAPGLPADGWSATWRGTLTPPATGDYLLALSSDDGSRLYVDGRLVIDHWGDHASSSKTATVALRAGRPVAIRVDYYEKAGEASLRLGWRVPGGPTPEQRARLHEAVELAKASDVAVVFADSLQTEGSDLPDIDLPGNQNALIAAVAAANPRTVVVLNTGSAVTMPWLDSVKAVIEAWYPGQEAGHAIAGLLFGDVNPSGKLPVTFPQRLADVPASTPAQWPGVDGRVEYSEGLGVGYRGYDARGIMPLFAFGSGLSYTRFAFSDLEVGAREIAPTGNVRVAVTLTNTGARQGADVVQLYVGHPAGVGEPPRQLKGFRKVSLAPGAAQRVTFDLPASAFATWSEQAHAWQVADGVYRIMLGDASDHLPMHATVRVSGAGSTQP